MMTHAPSNHASEVKVSAEVLSALVKAVEDLRKEVSQLRLDKESREAQSANTIEELRSEVARLRQQRIQDNSKIDYLEKELHLLPPKGRLFTLFPKLPKEVRLVIWDTILYTPQVIGVRQYFRTVSETRAVPQPSDREDLDIGEKHEKDKVILVPTGPHSLLRQVSKESRSQAIKVTTCYNICSSQPAPGLFANPEIDIIWLVDFLDVSSSSAKQYGFSWTHKHRSEVLHFLSLGSTMRLFLLIQKLPANSSFSLCFGKIGFTISSQSRGAARQK